MTDENEIQRILDKHGDAKQSYLGFNFGATHSQDNEPIKQHNKEICSLFGIDNPTIERLSCWKGSIILHEYPLIDGSFGSCYSFDEEEIEDFSGWTTAGIVSWLLNNKNLYKKLFKEYPAEEDVYMKDETIISRKIGKNDRYNVLKRQLWNCNICGCKLKYSKNNSWEAEIAHIDHIHPFSKRKTYINGEENINQLSNLQALCPKCNLSKSKKEIN